MLDEVLHLSQSRRHKDGVWGVAFFRKHEHAREKALHGCVCICAAACDHFCDDLLNNGEPRCCSQDVSDAWDMGRIAVLRHCSFSMGLGDTSMVNGSSRSDNGTAGVASIPGVLPPRRAPALIPEAGPTAAAGGLKPAGGGDLIPGAA
jgi:hypothetical protein